MIPSRRPRRSSSHGNVDSETTGNRDGTPPAAETARLRRERRNRSAGALYPSFLSSGPKRGQAPARSKPVTRTSSASRTKTFRSHSMARHSMATPPPVYMRGGMVNLPIQPRKLGAPPKRRYNVALNVPGAELHLPALPVLHMSWRVASGILAALMLALAVYLWTSPKYRIDMVDVSGLQRLTGNDINTVLVALAGQPIFAANPQQIREDLQQAFPDMMNISVKVGLPARVMVKAEERRPVIVWNQGGRELWIDMDGNAFSPRGNAGKLIMVDAQNDPPKIEKSSPTGALDPTDLRYLTPEMVGVIIRMAMKAPKDTALLYDSAHGLGWKDAFDCQVYFGTEMRDVDQKLLVYQALAARLQKDGIQARLISVEYVHAPYYRLEP